MPSRRQHGVFFNDRFFLYHFVRRSLKHATHVLVGTIQPRRLARFKNNTDPKTLGRGSKCLLFAANYPMIFGFGTYMPATSKTASHSREQRVTAIRAPRAKSVAADESNLSKAQIYDREHERKLRALHTLIEKGASVSEAARLIGVSRLCAHRWNNYGRR